MRNGCVILVISVLCSMGCGGGGGTTGGDSGTQLPDRALACRAAIDARETEVSAMLPDWSIDDAPEMVRTGGDQSRESEYAGRYRDDLATHPGCIARDAYGNNVEFLVQNNMANVPAGTPASIPGYSCAAKEYTQPAEDATKPIVILVHGNSSSVTTFEEWSNSENAGDPVERMGFSFTIDTEVREQLATRLVDAGYRVFAFDARTDLVSTLEDHNTDPMMGNAFRNIDHGWAVPMLQSLIRSVMTANPTRKVSLVGHSLGATVIRDALRRLYLEHREDASAINPYTRLQDVILLSGANHGVANGMLLCTNFPTQMRGTVACQMGDRQSFVPTHFTRPLNGPNDLFATPCADGSYAFGERDQCDGNVVEWTTVTMQDIEGGQLQDEFVSEASSKIDLEPCVENHLITLADYDTSGYFFGMFPGLFANHFGSARSDAGMTFVLETLGD
jgi:pimeloyl-ACP methyl ester carboxylesterase